jgi:hypothetical protein
MTDLSVAPGVLEQVIDHGLAAGPDAAAEAANSTAWLSPEWYGWPYYDNYLALRWDNAGAPGAHDFVALYDKPPVDPHGHIHNQWCRAANHRDGRYVTSVPADGGARWVAYVGGSPGSHRIVSIRYIGDGLAAQDAKATCGYYDVKGASSSSDRPGDVGVGGILHHAFAVLYPDQGGRVDFGCYGGTDRDPGKNLVFPADVYRPFIDEVNPRPQGKSMRAALSVARGMAQFTLRPDIRDSYGRTTGGYLNRGDCSGLHYGVEGVCHQMCNRVLWAASGNLGFTHTNVNWSPSMRVSHLLYGFWGVTGSMGAAVRLATELFRGSLPVSLSDADLEAAGVAGLKQHLETGYGRDVRTATVNQVMDSMLGRDFSEAYSITHQEGLIEADLEVHRRKRELDLGLLRGTVPAGQYARELNALVAGLVERYGDVLRPADFKAAFAAAPEDVRDVAVVAESMIPAHDPALGARLGL